MLDTNLGRFRLVAILEGLSFVILLFIAMPLKYFAGMPLAVRYVGLAHGLLFVAFVHFLIVVHIEHRWTLWRSVKAFISSLVPFGTFFLERELVRELPASS